MQFDNFGTGIDEKLAKKDTKVVKAQTKKFIFPFVHRKVGGLTIVQVFLKSVTSSQKISKASLKCKKTDQIMVR